jgi:hypothetical protein
MRTGRQLSPGPVDLAGYRKRREERMADPSIGDEVSLEPNGTVRLSLTGRPYRWRRPTFGEFRKLKELWASALEEDRGLVEAMNKETPEGERTAAWRIGYELKQRPLFADWVLEAWRLLGPPEKDVPAVDDLPPWMTNVQFPISLFDHWTTVPLAASSR